MSDKSVIYVYRVSFSGADSGPVAFASKANAQGWVEQQLDTDDIEWFEPSVNQTAMQSDLSGVHASIEQIPVIDAVGIASV